MDNNEIWERRKHRLYEIVDVGSTGDIASRIYDLVYTLIIFVNLAVNIMSTFDSLSAEYGTIFAWIDTVTCISFAVDYGLRIVTAEYIYRRKLPRRRAAVRYMISFSGIIDLLSFLPTFLPIFFPGGAVAFRMFRVIRIFRLFRINSYDDSLNIITSVLSSKSKQLLSSVSIILVLMLGASLCMYSLEHNAQPEVFTDAFSGIWWAASTLLTVGYGDIYPVTTAGKIFGIVITFLGVGMVAIPTGIISAGFVEQYALLKRISEQASEYNIHFIKVLMQRGDRWVGRKIAQLGLPKGVIVAAIQRKKKVIVPRGDVVLEIGDALVLGAEHFVDDWHIDLKEVVLRRHSPWNGQYIRDLDISRQTIIVLVKRRGKMLIPSGDLILHEGDEVLLYTKEHLSDSTTVNI